MAALAGLVRRDAFRARRDRVGVDAGGPCLGEEGGEPVDQRLRLVLAGARQQALAADAGLDVGARNSTFTACSM